MNTLSYAGKTVHYPKITMSQPVSERKVIRDFMHNFYNVISGNSTRDFNFSGSHQILDSTT